MFEQLVLRAPMRFLINFRFFGKLMPSICFDKNIFDSGTSFSSRVTKNILSWWKISKNSSYMSLSLYTYCDDFRLYNFLSLIITIQIAIIVIFIKLYCGNLEKRKFSQAANCPKKNLTKILGFEKKRKLKWLIFIKLCTHQQV